MTTKVMRSVDDAQAGFATITAADVGADVAGAAATAASGAASALSSHEADTTSIHGIANTANLYAAGGTDVAVADGGTGAGTAAGARTNLGLVIGTDVQAQDADIATVSAAQGEMEAGTEAALRSMSPLRVAQAIAALGGEGGGAPTTADYLVGTAQAGLSNEIVVTAAGLALLDDAAASNQRATLGLVIETDVAAYVPASGFGTPLTGALAETYGRNSGSGNNATLVSARLQMVAIQLPKGMTVTTISFVSATTALGTGVNQWFALFDISRNMLRVTNDDTSTAWAANSAKTLTCTTPYLVPTSGLYYIGCMVKATTVPTLLGIGALGVIAGLVPILHGDSTTGLTDPASCPNPAGALQNATTTKLCYAYVS